MNAAGVTARSRRARILLVARNFPPEVGGIQRYLKENLDQLAEQFDVALAGPDGCAEFAPKAARVAEVRAKPLPWFMAATFVEALTLALRFRPDLVLAGSGLMAPHAVLIARLCGAKSAVFAYGLDLVVDNAVYQRLWLPAIRACDGVITISRRTRALAIEKGVATARLTDIVHPGTSIDSEAPASADAFRSAHKLASKRILLSVGRLVARKGVYEFVERSLPAIAAARPDAVFVVIGREAGAELAGGSGDVGMRARASARRNGIEDHLLMLGEVDEATLRQAWCAADVHVFAGRELRGDLEGFGMVCVEAAAHGVPTVAFDVGGVADAVDPMSSGSLLRADDYAALTAAVLSRLGAAPLAESAKAPIRAFAARFSWDAIGVTLRAVAAKLIGIEARR